MELNLKQRRILANKRQIDVYLETGITPSRLSLIENGLAEPRPKELLKLEELYGKGANDIVQVEGSR